VQILSKSANILNIAPFIVLVSASATDLVGKCCGKTYIKGTALRLFRPRVLVGIGNFAVSILMILSKIF
jgi:hypothetical protein